MSEVSPVLFKKRYVYEDTDRHGNVRTWFWRGKGHKKCRVRVKRGSSEFDALYHEWLRRTEAGESKPAPRDAPKPHTLRWLGVQYSSSTEFDQLDPRTQYVSRRILESIYLEPIAPSAKETFGDCPIAHFGAKAVGIVRDRKKVHPEAANNRLKRLRAMFRWAMLPAQADLGIPQIPLEMCPS